VTGHTEKSRHTFPAAMRVKLQRDFDRIYRARASVSDHRLVVYAAPNELGHSRLGLAVSRKLGNAVVRNRYKRLLREAFRLDQNELPRGYDFILIPRSGSGPAELQQYRISFGALAAKAVARWDRKQANRDQGDAG
jgi:ribonuclease P protein component